jgi:hypothetical protein
MELSDKNKLEREFRNWNNSRKEGLGLWLRYKINSKTKRKKMTKIRRNRVKCTQALMRRY